MRGSATWFEVSAWLQSHLILPWVLLQHSVSVPVSGNYTNILIHDSDGSNSKYFMWLIGEQGENREQKISTEK